MRRSRRVGLAPVSMAWLALGCALLAGTAVRASPAGGPAAGPRQKAGASPAGAEARESPAGAWIAALQVWTRAVGEHAPGAADAPADLVGGWSEIEVNQVRDDFLALVRLRLRAGPDARPRESITYRKTVVPIQELDALLGLTRDDVVRGHANRVLYRAAILHADAAMLVIPFAPAGTGCSSVPTVLGIDGGYVGSGCLGLHWAQARALLDAVRPGPAGDPFVRDWYHATLVHLLESADYAEANAQIEHARPFLSDDPSFLFQHAFYHEAFAAPFIQPAAVAARADPREPAAHLREAEALFRKTLQLDPGNVEARVHLAFVLGELRRPREAAEELRIAASSAAPPDLQYYAELFLGRALQALGRRDAAGECYTRAARLFPGAQSPLLALALLARASGDRAGAQDVLQRLMALPPDRETESDPWWAFRRLQHQRASAIFDHVYRPFRAGGSP